METRKWEKKIAWLAAAAFGMFLALFLNVPQAVSAAAGNPGQVRVIIENTTFDEADGAVWGGTLMEKEVAITDGMNALEAVEAAVESEGLAMESAVSQYGGSYITVVNGLKEKDENAGPQSGWLGTVNDCFGNVSLDNTPVKDGDEIRIMYSVAWGNDLRANVIVENNKYGKEEGAPWEGQLLYGGIRATEGLTALEAVERVLASEGQSITDPGNYITEIGGLKATDGGEKSGWMATVNGCFGKVGLNDIQIEAGDEICVMYTMSWGSDLEVRVVVENNTYTQDTAPWSGELLDIYRGVYVSGEMTALEAVKKVVETEGEDIVIDKESYITGIGGLSEGDGGGKSGWMAAVNGSFGEVGLNETAVKPGDEIRVQYTTAWGDDLKAEQKLTGTYTGNKSATVGQKLKQQVSGAATEVTFASSDTKVATVGKTTGAVTCKGVGKAVITATAAGSREYKEASAKFTLTVNPEAVQVKSAKSTKKGKVTVKSDGTAKGYCDGYKIQYRQGKNGKAQVMTVKNKDKKALTCIISKLKSGKNCQIRICAYKKVGGKTYTGKYGSWRNVKKVK